MREYPNVVGIDGELQPKIRGGKIIQDSMSIRVYVSKKIPLSEFKKKKNKFSFRKFLTVDDIIPSTINNFTIDIVEMGEAFALNIKPSITLSPPPPPPKEVVASRPVIPRLRTQLKYRPLLAGTSATHFQSTACTLNCLFIENGTGRLLMASNNHCFGRENRAKIGDPILQPSPYDGGIAPKDQIGEFYKFVEIRFGEYKHSLRNKLLKIRKTFRSMEDFFNRVDIAFASFKCSNCPVCNPITNACLVKVYGIGLPIGKRLPDLNQKVQKVGRTTGKTVGTVISTSWTGIVKYSRGTATFIDCILVSGNNFSLGGDSGSPVLDMDGNYIGALFGGSENYSIVCKASNIEKEGNVELVVLPLEIKHFPEIIIKQRKQSKKKKKLLVN